VSGLPAVLVVDDSAADRELIGRLLAPHFRVLAACDVPQGLEIVRREHPDCVLLDNQMPGIVGLDGLIEFVRAKAVVIMMSGGGGEELAAEAFRRGARDFVRKSSLTAPVLVRMITRERERRRLEIELLATQERFDEVAARIGEVLWMRSLEGQFLYLSPAFEQVWGRPREGMTTQLWESFVHPEDRVLERAADGHWADGVEHEVEFRIVRPDGRVRRIRNRGYPIFEDGRVARVGGIARDVTEEVRLQQELRLAQKLEAIGQLAAGVAHEINTPAQYVSDNIAFMTDAFRDLRPLLDACAELARSEPAADVDRLRELARRADLVLLADELPSALQQTTAGIAQIKKIVQAMKELSHPSDEMKIVDLNRAIETAVTVTRNQWKYVADVDLELSPSVNGLACHPSEINQVLLNLIVNAAHAIEDVVGSRGAAKGKITIATDVDGDHVVIRVADTGGGIPEAIRDKIYDPFFTTKAIGRGTGQGLAIVHRIVREHHAGTIDFDSTVGQGTCFVIRLPVASAPHGRAASGELALGTLAGGRGAG
jgi:PAS domain S-box-containing protein